VPEVELGEVDTHGDHVVAGLLQHVLQVHLQYRNTISIVHVLKGESTKKSSKYNNILLFKLNFFVMS
jgi:hypothetical protein